MSLAQALSLYATLNVLVGLGYGALVLVESFAPGRRKSVEGPSGLHLHYAVLSAVLLLVCVQPLVPKKAFFEPTAKVWSASSLKSFSQDYTASESGGYLAFPTRGGTAVVSADRVSLVLGFILALVSGVGFWRVARDWVSLRRLRKESYVIKRLGKIQVMANEGIAVPFSYWTPGQAAIVIPGALLARQREYRMVVAHELQHHRQRDTQWVYALWALRVLCFANPAAHLWNRRISELQEFACDSTLVDRSKVEPGQYARCLVEMAETALRQEQVPACATGLVFLAGRHLLKRRVEAMIENKKRTAPRSKWIAVAGVIATLMTATVFASQSLVQDRRVSLVEAQAMAARHADDSSFPIAVNDLVLKELNRFIGTPEGRDYMRTSLRRMEDYRPMIEDKLQEYRVPLELLALPIIESGYQNLEPNGGYGRGAGLWMFIESTARIFGLRVDNRVDERLNPELETDAAMRYLKVNQLRFKDWLLSVLAYNIGESRVQRAIEKTGSRDAWTLVRAGYENDKSYLPRVVAAILIMKNPEFIAR